MSKIEVLRMGEALKAEWRNDPWGDEVSYALDLTGPDIEECANQLQCLAEQGSALAMMYLGEALLFGRYGLKVDTELGCTWLNKAFDSGSRESGFLLARLLQSQSQYAEMLDVHSKLTQMGFSPSMYAMGIFHFYGRFVEKSLEQAISYFELGESHGHLHCKHWISHLMMSSEVGYGNFPLGLMKRAQMLALMAWFSLRHPKSDRLRTRTGGMELLL